MAALSPRQAEVLNLISESVRTRGYPPSIRELCEATGLTSTSSVAHHIRQLEVLGRIRRDPSKPRALTILPPPCAVCARPTYRSGLCRDCWQDAHNDTDLENR